MKRLTIVGLVSFPILMYHSISNNPMNRLCVPKEQFEHQLELLKKTVTMLWALKKRSAF